MCVVSPPPRHRSCSRRSLGSGWSSPSGPIRSRACCVRLVATQLALFGFFALLTLALLVCVSRPPLPPPLRSSLPTSLMILSRAFTTADPNLETEEDDAEALADDLSSDLAQTLTHLSEDVLQQVFILLYLLSHISCLLAGPWAFSVRFRLPKSHSFHELTGAVCNSRRKRRLRMKWLLMTRTSSCRTDLTC